MNKREVLKAKRTGNATITVTARKGKKRADKKVKMTVVKGSRYKHVV